MHNIEFANSAWLWLAVSIWLAMAVSLWCWRKVRPDSFGRMVAGADRRPFFAFGLSFFAVRFDRTGIRSRRHFRPGDRQVGEPQLTLWPGCKQTWVLTLDFYGDSTYEQEMRSLPLEGWSSHLYHDYLVLARAKALAFIESNGLVLSQDHSTVAGVEMIVFRRQTA